MPFFKDSGRCPKILDYTLHVNLYEELETWCTATTLSSCCILGPTIIAMKLLIKGSPYFPILHLGWFTVFSNAELGLIHCIFQCCTWVDSPYFPMLHLGWFTVFSNTVLGLVHRIFQCWTWFGSLYFPMLHLGWFTIISSRHWSYLGWFTIFSNAALGLVHHIFWQTLVLFGLVHHIFWQTLAWYHF